MNRKRWERVKRLFGRARLIPAEERRAFLVRECRGDDSVISQVLRLLGHEDHAGRFLDPPVEAELAQPLEAAAASLDGTRIGDFELLEEIGRGAMGVVYLARQMSLKRKVAVKILARHLLDSPERQERFRREALAASRLRHPNIVTIIAFGDQGRVPYIAMEYVAGKSLRESLGEIRKGDPGPPAPGRSEGFRPASAARVVLGIARALEHCHGLGIIHRDIKPHNILLDEHGEPRLVDFGLAKDLDLETISQEGSVAGTPHYMSPEQAQALGTEVDHRTDIYSTGAVLYELLTLHKPFEGPNSPAILHSIVHERPKSIAVFAPGVPRALAAICMKAMSRRPESRYPVAREMVLDLERFLAGERVRAPRPSLLRQSYEFVFHAHSRAAATLAVVLFAALVLLTPRQAMVLASDATRGSQGLSGRRSGDGLLPPSRDEATLKVWRQRMQSIIDDGLKNLPQEPTDH